MFPEDVNLTILSFLGTTPRKRCWCRTRNRTRCKNKVKNKKACIFCPLHETKRFNLPLYKPFEDIAYIMEKIGSQKSNPILSHPSTKRWQSFITYPSLTIYPTFMRWNHAQNHIIKKLI